jgi:hypothetical protein
MMIEKFFTILQDGKWHDLTELTDQLKVQTDRLVEFLKFLSKKGIISYRDKTHKLKIKPEWQSILIEETKPTYKNQ